MPDYEKLGAFYLGKRYAEETDTLTDELIPELLESLELSLQQHYPGHEFTIPPFFYFCSWIGGDRDGNPFVTVDTTRRALRQNSVACLTHYRGRLRQLLHTLSIARHMLRVPVEFEGALGALV